MIIPPDPEKDPNLFAESTTSLVLPPSEFDVDSSIDHPVLTPVRLPAATYRPVSASSFASYPFGDELAFGNSWEVLPPYEGRRARPSTSISTIENDIFADPSPSRRTSQRASSSVLIRQTSRASTASTSSLTSSRRTPVMQRSSIHHLPSSPVTEPTVVADTSSSKLWEGTVPSTRDRHRRVVLGVTIPWPTVPPGVQKWWLKYRRWVQALLVLLLIGIGLTIGLVVGFSSGLHARDDSDIADQPWFDTGDGDGNGNSGSGRPSNNAWQTPNLNLTYVPSRDGPSSADGTPTSCNQFSPLNASTSLTQLAVSSTYYAHAITTFTFPVQKAQSSQLLTLPEDLFFIARGLAASGTVEFVGTDGPDDVISGGEEDNIKVDIIVRYADNLDLNNTVNVCQMTRSDGSVGVGIYTPIKTVGGVSNPYILDPLLTPAFHVIVRLPPSIVLSAMATSMYLPTVSLDLAQMAVRIGNMQNVLDIGDLELSTGRGGVVVEYIATEILNIQAGTSSVQGRFNVSTMLNVNATSGTILADVILYNPANPEDNSTSIDSSLPITRRSLTSSLNDRGHNQEENLAAEIQAPTHSVNTSFTSAEGFIYVAYVHHPPDTALLSYVSSSGGMIDVSMHPNYVGPFAMENQWGEVRLPPVSISDSYDPLGEGRSRAVVQGTIDMSAGTMFAEKGVNDTSIALSASTITGAAYWSNGQSVTALDVQQGTEGHGSELVVVGCWGDLQVTFDGT